MWPRRRGLKGPAVAVLLTILGNGVVGGMAVRGDLHPTLVQSHFILAMLSIGFGLVAVHRSGPMPVGRRADIGITPLVTGLFVTLGLFVAAALVTGTVVTGAGPHAGDETARRYGFDISTVAEVHSVTVWSPWRCSWRWRRVAADADGHRLVSNLSTWMFLAVLQGGIGYVQYFNNVPAVLAGAHVAGATALWVATVWLILGGLEPGSTPATSSCSRNASRGRRVVASGEHPLSSAAYVQTSRRRANRTDGVGGAHGDGLVGVAVPCGASQSPDGRVRRDHTPREARRRRREGPVPGAEIVVYEAVIDDRVIESLGEEVGRGTMDATGFVSVGLPGPGQYVVELNVDTLPPGVELVRADKQQLPVEARAGEVSRVLFNLAEGDAAGAAGDKESDGIFTRGARLLYEGIIFGLIIGLCAIGLSLIFGTTGLVNFALSEQIVFGPSSPTSSTPSSAST